MMKFSKLASLLIVFSFLFLSSCSSDDGGGSGEGPNTTEGTDVNEDNGDSEPEGNSTGGDSEPEVDNTGGDSEPEVDNTGGDSEPEVDNTGGDSAPEVDNTSSLTERFIFDKSLVIENSYFLGPCAKIPCKTEDDELDGIFVDYLPNENYFSLSDDQSELLLECLLDEGRRIEFKQDSEGPLDSFSSLSMEGVYYDIPDNGVTIAQVHNRGGSTNKPFFRLVLHKDGLETVVREKPEVSSEFSDFDKEENISFANGGDYDLSPLKIVISKSEGSVHLNVEQNGVTILDESYAPDSSTRWVTDNGIANGFYLKGGLYNDDGPHTKNLVVGYTTVMFETDDQL